MRVVLFGATGMIGSAALIECLAHPDVEAVLAVGRRSCGVRHEKLSELLHADLTDLWEVTERLRGYDACLYCLGVSAAGMTEDAYARITRDMAIAAGQALLAVNPKLVFCFVSGAGADSTEKGRVMWARVKGRTENELQRMPFEKVWIFRPAFVQPMKGVRSRTRLYNLLYAVLGPVHPLLKAVVPKYVTTTERVALALIRAARDGAPTTVLENEAIDELGEAERRRLHGGA